MSNQLSMWTDEEINARQKDSFWKGFLVGSFTWIIIFIVATTILL